MSDLTVTVQNGICHIAITRPAKRNTVDAATCLSWVKVFAEAQKDDEVRCVVLSGEDNIFCAGADFNETLHRSAEIQQAYDSLIEAMIAFDKPILAAVQGPAVGGDSLLQRHGLLWRKKPLLTALYCAGTHAGVCPDVFPLRKSRL